MLGNPTSQKFSGEGGRWAVHLTVDHKNMSLIDHKERERKKLRSDRERKEK